MGVYYIGHSDNSARQGAWSGKLGALGYDFAYLGGTSLPAGVTATWAGMAGGLAAWDPYPDSIFLPNGVDRVGRARYATAGQFTCTLTGSGSTPYMVSAFCQDLGNSSRSMRLEAYDPVTAAVVGSYQTGVGFRIGGFWTHVAFTGSAVLRFVVVSGISACQAILIDPYVPHRPGVPPARALGHFAF